MVKIISRKSDLAIIQAHLVGNAIKSSNDEISIEYIFKNTRGDIDLTTPLSKLPDVGVFTSDLRDSLMSEEADIAVHSWKDLPIELTKGTKIIGTLPRADMRDIVFFKKSSCKTNVKYVLKFYWCSLDSILLHIKGASLAINCLRLCFCSLILVYID